MNYLGSGAELFVGGREARLCGNMSSISLVRRVAFLSCWLSVGARFGGSVLVLVGRLTQNASCLDEEHVSEQEGPCPASKHCQDA